MACQIIELNRMQQQIKLDSLKSLEDRNKAGQYATSYDMANEITSHVANNFIPESKKNLSFLEPAVGTGVFINALLSSIKVDSLNVKGIEIDPVIFNSTSEIWKNYNLDLINDDFFKVKVDKELYDLLITNPPYVRHHHISKEMKAKLKGAVKDEFDIKVSSFSGLYCYFIFMSHKWLKENGTATWLIPSEYLDVNYGAAVKEYLTKFVTVKQIHKYDSSSTKFSDALVSSSVLIYEKTKPEENSIVRFTYGDSIENPEIIRDVPLRELNPNEKWSKKYSNITLIRNEEVLGDYFNIKRGIATGANSFFILNRDQILTLELPFECFKPILPSIKELETNIIESDINGFPTINSQYFVLDLDLSMDEIKNKYPNLFIYLQNGIEDGILEGYLVKKRKIWYKQETRKPAPFYCTYMGRSSKAKTFKLIWNKSNVIITNNYLALYPKENLIRAIDSNKISYQEVYDVLNTITEENFLLEGREYGGGLKKIEPKELEKVKLNNLKSLIRV